MLWRNNGLKPLKHNDPVLLFNEEKEPVAEAFVHQTHELEGLQPGRVGVLINAVFMKTPMTLLKIRGVEVELKKGKVVVWLIEQMVCFSFPLIFPFPKLTHAIL